MLASLPQIENSANDKYEGRLQLSGAVVGGGGARRAGRLLDSGGLPGGVLVQVEGGQGDGGVRQRLPLRHPLHGPRHAGPRPGQQQAGRSTQVGRPIRS